MQPSERRQRPSIKGIQFQSWFVVIGLFTAFVVGSLAAVSFVLVQSDGLRGLVDAPFWAFVLAHFVIIGASVPAIIVAWVGEKQAIQDVMYYMLGAIGSGIPALCLMSITLTGGIAPVYPYAPALLVGGCSAGYAYWLIAGRYAGSSRHGRTSSRI